MNSRMQGLKEALAAKEMFPQVAKGLISGKNRRVRLLLRNNLAKQGKSARDL